ncbi:MAG TPA: chaperone modulator CbpM [Acidimicrobiales bacterium]|nr:chaperone modulator CbpM [Acidimicrobiales bacterium]
MTAALVRRPVLGLDTFARLTGLHPDLARRLVALGLLEAATDAAGELWFPPAQLAAADRLQRLRAGLPLNYAALGLVCHLLDRVAELEAALRSTSSTRPRDGGRPWTPTD